MNFELQNNLLFLSFYQNLVEILIDNNFGSLSKLFILKFQSLLQKKYIYLYIYTSKCSEKLEKFKNSKFL